MLPVLASCAHSHALPMLSQPVLKVWSTLTPQVVNTATEKVILAFEREKSLQGKLFYCFCRCITDLKVWFSLYHRNTEPFSCLSAV